MALEFLVKLEEIINDRHKTKDSVESYTSSLFKEGLDRIAQKVGEEAIETVIAAKNIDQAEFENEAADLLFHLLVLLKAKNSSLSSIVKVLEARN